MFRLIELIAKEFLRLFDVCNSGVYRLHFHLKCVYFVMLLIIFSILSIFFTKDLMVLISSIISVAHKGGAIIADAAIGPGSDDVKGGGDRILNSPPKGICGKFRYFG